MAKLQVLNPVSVRQSAETRSDPAPRPGSLDGKKVGLIWNRKYGGNAVLERVGTRLRERFADVDVRLYPGGIPVPQAVLDEAIKECDVFVGASSD